MRIKSFLFKAGSALAPLLLVLALGGASTAEAAGPIVVVAPNATPTDCGKYHSAQTDLSGALSAATTGQVLVCPGEYVLAGGTTISNAKNLTIAQAVKGVRPLIDIDTSAEVGLEIDQSSNVILNGLTFNGAGSTQPLVVLDFVDTTGKVSDSHVIGSATTATGILVTHFGGAGPIKFSVSGSEVRGYQTFGLYVGGPVAMTVNSSLFDSTDSGRIMTTNATGVMFDGSSEDHITPTGTITGSRFLTQRAGVTLVDTSGVVVSKNTFDHSSISVWIDQVGHNHPNVKNNKVTGNKLFDCSTCLLVENDASDPVRFQLLNTVVTGNTFKSPNVSMIVGVDFVLFAPAKKTMTGTVSGNVFNAISRNAAIFNNHDWAGIRIGRNKFIT